MSPAELEINLAALKRTDPFVRNIVETASQVALYNFTPHNNEWEKTEVEGCMFVYSRSEAPVYGFTIMNRLNTENHMEAVSKDLELQVQSPYLLYKNPKGLIRGIWFYEDSDCAKIATLMKKLIDGGKFTGGSASKSHSAASMAPMTQVAQQAQPQSYQFGQQKQPGQDILSILSKATNDYDSARGNFSPPVDGGHMIIKPTPLRMNNGRSATIEAAGPSRQSLSVAELFGGVSDPPVSQRKAAEQPVVPDILQRLLSSSNSESLISSISSGAHVEVAELEKKLRSTQLTPKGSTAASVTNGNDLHKPVISSLSDFVFDNNQDIQRQSSYSLLQPLSMETSVKPTDDSVKFFLPSPLSPRGDSEIGALKSAALITPMDLLNSHSSESSTTHSFSGDGMMTPNAENSLLLDVESSALNYSIDKSNDLMPMGQNNAIAPLTKGQMIQAFRYLLKNDQHFVAQLHQAYLQSLNEGFGLPPFNGGGLNSTLK